MKLSSKSKVLIATSSFIVSSLVIAGIAVGSSSTLNKNQGLNEVREQINQIYKNDQNAIKPTFEQSNYAFKNVPNKVSDYSLKFFLINQLGFDPLTLENVESGTFVDINPNLDKNEKLLSQTTKENFLKVFDFTKFNQKFGNRFQLNLKSITFSLKDGAQQLVVSVFSSPRSNPDSFHSDIMTFTFGNELFASNQLNLETLITNFNKVTSNVPETQILLNYETQNNTEYQFKIGTIINNDFNFTLGILPVQNSTGPIKINFLGFDFYIFLANKTLNPNAIPSKSISWIANSVPTQPTLDPAKWNKTTYNIELEIKPDVPTPIQYDVVLFNKNTTAEQVLASKPNKYETTLRLKTDIVGPGPINNQRDQANDLLFGYDFGNVVIEGNQEDAAAIRVEVNIYNKDTGLFREKYEKIVQVLSVPQNLINNIITDNNLSNYIDVQIKPEFVTQPLSYFANIVPSQEELARHFTLTIKPEVANNKGISTLDFQLSQSFISIQNTPERVVFVTINVSGKSNPETTSLFIFKITKGFSTT
ncbi:MAG: hypothetical protein ACRDAW_02240 [Metamycoplasmataceae bacterium]